MPHECGKTNGSPFFFQFSSSSSPLARAGVVVRAHSSGAGAESFELKNVIGRHDRDARAARKPRRLMKNTRHVTSGLNAKLVERRSARLAPALMSPAQATGARLKDSKRTSLFRVCDQRPLSVSIQFAHNIKNLLCRFSQRLNEPPVPSFLRYQSNLSFSLLSFYYFFFQLIFIVRLLPSAVFCLD